MKGKVLSFFVILFLLFIPSYVKALDKNINVVYEYNIGNNIKNTDLKIFYDNSDVTNFFEINKITWYKCVQGSSLNFSEYDYVDVESGSYCLIVNNDDVFSDSFFYVLSISGLHYIESDEIIVNGVYINNSFVSSFSVNNGLIDINSNFIGNRGIDYVPPGSEHDSNNNEVSYDENTNKNPLEEDNDDEEVEEKQEDNNQEEVKVEKDDVIDNNNDGKTCTWCCKKILFLSICIWMIIDIVLIVLDILLIIRRVIKNRIGGSYHF